MTSDIVKLCNHTNTIFDYKTDTEICQCCGLVITEQCFLINESKNKYILPHSNDYLKNNSIVLSITDFLVNYHFSSCYIEPVKCEYENILKKVPNKHIEKSMYFAYALYLTLKKSNNYKPLDDIIVKIFYNDQQLYKIALKKIHEIDKIYKPVILPLNINNMVEDSCNPFNIHFNDIIRIQKLVQLIEEKDLASIKPLTLIGACIYYHCQHLPYKLKLKNIADNLNITTNTIRRFYYQFYEEFINVKY